METKVGGFKSSDNNSTSIRYKKMGKGTELTKIICNLHMKVLGQLTNEVDIDLKPSNSSRSSSRSTCSSNKRQQKINNIKNQNNYYNNRHIEMIKCPTIVKIPEIIKVSNNHNDDDGLMDAPLDLKVRVKSERVDNVKTEPDKSKNSANNDAVEEFRPKLNECEICRKQFSSCYSLQRHMRGVHDKQKPHLCQVCLKSFTQLSHLKKHHQTHIEEIVVTPLIFPPPGEEDSDSIKSPLSNDSKIICDATDDQIQQQTQHYFECINCHKSFNLINNFKVHRQMCHLMRNKNIMGNSHHHHQVNRQHTSKKKRKKLRLHQTFFACRRMQSIRRLCYKNLRKLNEFECQVRGCFSSCPNYKMYMEHICTHSNKFRLSKSKYKTHNNIIKTENKNRTSSPSNILLTTTFMEVNNENENDCSTPLPLVMDMSEPEDFFPLSGFGGLLEEVQSFVPLAFPFINSIPQLPPSLPSNEIIPQISTSQIITPEMFPTTMDFDKGSSCYQCLDCGKEFARKFSYDRHRRIHLGHRPFCCEVCGYQFSQQSHLKKHIRQHENENASASAQNSTTHSTPNDKAAAVTTNDTTTNNNNCKVQSPTAVNSVNSKITTPILNIPIRLPKIDESSKILQPNENINGNPNGVRRSSRRRN